MYSIYADGICIYNDAFALDNMKVIDPKLTLEDSAAGSLSMTLPPSNIGYGTIVRMVSDISVHKDGEEIWAGRVLSEDKDFWNNRVLYCEGELAFLNDSTQPPAEYYGQTVRGFLETLINIHNSKVADDKQFTIGSVTVTDSDDPLYRYTNYEKTIECINEKLVKKLGGHLRIRKVDGVRYLDYLADYPNTNSQIIEFGKNLLDFTRKWDLTEFATVIVPLGNRLDESPIEALDAYLTVESVNNGSLYVQSSEAVASYGWIEKVIHWDDVSTASSLLSKAEAYLSDIQFDNMSIELSALDLHYLDVNYEAVKLLDELRVVSKPHGMDRHFPVTKLEIPLDSPEKTLFKLGDTIETSLTSVNNQTNTNILRKIENLPKAQSVLKEAKENATQIMNMATNGYITITQDQYGTNTMYISNDKDYTKATKLWKWNVNGLGYSNDGGETFGLAMTMDGAIVADFITAGILNADLIKTGKLQDIDGNVIFDLSTGTLTFKKGSINIGNGAFKVDADGKLTATKGYFSGDVIMGPGSVITWDNLPYGVAAIYDIPTSPGDIGALPASDLPSYITKTKITQTTIESPDIRGGTITSDTTIDVGTDLKVGNNVYLGKYVQWEDKHIYLKDTSFLYTVGDSLGITSMGNIIISAGYGDVYIGSSDSPNNRVATKGDIGTPVAVFG